MKHLLYKIALFFHYHLPLHYSEWLDRYVQDTWVKIDTERRKEELKEWNRRFPPDVRRSDGKILTRERWGGIKT